MNKRRSSLDTVQLGFTFDPPTPAQASADLAGFERLIAAKVARALKDDDRSREVIAAEMSDLLGGEEVTRFMLDAYASEAREQHNISAGRFLALIAVTGRFDLLDAATRRIGAAVLVGEELLAAHLGHLKAQERNLRERIRAAERAATPIMRGASGT